jgi:(2R)-3-sulfolactate dehydrogenase (NADP+)
MIGTMFSNSPHAMAAWGGRRGLLGTNPIAFAAPVPGRDPIVVDMALSVVARGKIMHAAQKGEPIPEGWANDADGRPTTDAANAMAGTLAPLGGAKGAALALMVEVMAAALTGANLAFQASSFFDAEGPPPAIGQFLIAIDPAAFGGDAAAQRIGELVEAIEAEGTARIPGSLRRARREKAAGEGIAVEDALFARLAELAGAA